MPVKKLEVQRFKVVDLVNTESDISLKKAVYADWISVSYWSRATVTEIGGRVNITGKKGGGLRLL